MSVKITRNMAAIQAKIKAGNSMMIPAVTESVIEYGNVFVPEDQGTLNGQRLDCQQATGRISYLGHSLRETAVLHRNPVKGQESKCLPPMG